MIANTERVALAQFKRSADVLFTSLEQRIAKLDERESLVEALREGLECEREAWLQEQAKQKAALDSARARAELQVKLQAEIQTELLAERRAFQEKRRSCQADWTDENHSPNFRENIGTRHNCRPFANAEEQDPGLSVFSTVVHLNGEGGRHLQSSVDLFLPVSCVISALDATCTPYEEVRNAEHGLAFEVCASRSLQLLALETCSGSIRQASVATVYMCRGSLTQHLAQQNAWTQVGAGILCSRRGSRLELSVPVLLPEGTPHCIYIATNSHGGIAFEPTESSEVIAQNEDLRMHPGLLSHGHFSFSAGSWCCFNGKLEYSRLE